MIAATVKRTVLLMVLVCWGAPGAMAQNPVQWSGNVEQSVARASEQWLPLLFWVTGDSDQDEDDLDDAQEECFRDPVVVDIIHRRFVPVRVARNSRVIKAAERLGLPTEFGLYCAVLTTDGRLLDSMGPAEVADPRAFAEHLLAASAHYLDDLYESRIRPALEDPTAEKAQVRLAAQTVYRLGIRRADGDIIRLLERPDLTPSERARLYSLLAHLGTQASVSTLLARADEAPAAAALLKAEPGALEWLLPALPGEDGPVDSSQLAAYRAAIHACHMASSKPDAWWEGATPEDRVRELERVRTKAEAVLEYWSRQQGG